MRKPKSNWAICLGAIVSFTLWTGSVPAATHPMSTRKFEKIGDDLPALVKEAINRFVRETRLSLRCDQVVLVTNLEEWLSAKSIAEAEREEFRESDAFTRQFTPGVTGPPFFPLYLR